MKGKSLRVMAFAGIVVLSLLLPLYAQPKNDEQIAALKEEAVSIAKRFGGMLKPRLKEALQTGGPVKAIDVCSTQAPQIASELSRETGWQVKRVSLNPRNKQTAIPDAWEQKVLEQFNERQAQGESPETIAYTEVVNGQFRFMKAQGVESICLACHGKAVSPEVGNALKQYYPDDKATGYSLGKIRGAFSLSKKL